MKQLATSLNNESIKKIEQIAKEKEISVSSLMRMMILEKLKEVAPSIPDGQSKESKEPSHTPRGG